MTVEELLPFDRRVALKYVAAAHRRRETFVDGVATTAPIRSCIDAGESAAIEVDDSPDLIHEPFIENQPFAVGKCGRLTLIWSKNYQQRPWGGR